MHSPYLPSLRPSEYTDACCSPVEISYKSREIWHSDGSVLLSERLIHILKPFPMISFVLPLSNEVVVPPKVHNTVDSIQRSHVNMSCT